MYRIGGKCHEFKTEIVTCPSSGMVESFEEQQVNMQEYFADQFCRRGSPIRT